MIRHSFLKRSPAFSLLEVLPVIAILGIIAVIVIPRMAGNALTANKSSCSVQKVNIEIQAQLWYRNKSAWPAANLSDIGADTAYFPEGLPQCAVDGSSYTLDATTHQVFGHTH